MNNAMSAPSAQGTARTVERYFQFSLFSLLAIGFATLALTGKLDIGSVLFGGIALTTRGWLLLREREMNIPERWTSYLTLGYVAIYAVDYAFISHDFVTATVHLVIFSVVTKIFSVHRERDYTYLAILAFLMVLASAVLTVDTLFVIEFSVFLLVSISTAIAMEMRRSIRDSANARGSAERLPTLNTAVVRLSAAMMLTILIFASAIFFLLPRVSAGYLSSLAAQNTITSGFSSDVRLGEIGRIQQSSAVIMHVKFFEPPPSDLRFRGVALTNFDGERWSNPARAELASGRSSAFARPLRERPRMIQIDRLRKAHYYSVMMEPMTSNVFFLVPEAVNVSGDYRDFGIGPDGEVYDEDSEHQITKYIASFQPMPVGELAGIADGRDYPRNIAIDDLQLPAIDPRIADLARQITKDSKTNVDRAFTIEHYLSNHYGYTLQLLDAHVRDPLAFFLFTRKQGHCEYFASSMAVMLRTLGIPARIVNGFRGGEYNDVDGEYVVRGRDAHSWVEAYFPGYGWAEFDPTPAASQPSTGHWSRLLLYLDAGQEFWREWIINYDYGHQHQLNGMLAHGARNEVARFRRWSAREYRRMLRRVQSIQQSASHAPIGWGARALALLLVFVLALRSTVLLQWFRRALLARRPAQRPVQAASVWYSRMLRSLSRRGFTKTATQTPREFAAKIDDHALQAPLTRFVDLYESARFGESAEDAARLPDAFEQVEEALKDPR